MNAFMREAIALSREGMRGNEGGPFGAVIVKDGAIIGRGNNRVIMSNDPTAHAEINAIREACKYLNTFQLHGCEIYTSCEPCPMCLSAIYWSRISRIYFACNRHDAASIGFDDNFLYNEFYVDPDKRRVPIEQIMQSEACEVFKEWEMKTDKKMY